MNEYELMNLGHEESMEYLNFPLDKLEKGESRSNSIYGESESTTSIFSPLSDPHFIDRPRGVLGVFDVEVGPEDPSCIKPWELAESVEDRPKYFDSEDMGAFEEYIPSTLMAHMIHMLPNNYLPVGDVGESGGSGPTRPTVPIERHNYNEEINGYKESELLEVYNNIENIQNTEPESNMRTTTERIYCEGKELEEEIDFILASTKIYNYKSSTKTRSHHHNNNTADNISNEENEGKMRKNVNRRKRKNCEQLGILGGELEKRGELNKTQIRKVSKKAGLTESQVYKWLWDKKKRAAENNATHSSKIFLD